MMSVWKYLEQMALFISGKLYTTNNLADIISYHTNK